MVLGAQGEREIIYNRVPGFRRGLLWPRRPRPRGCCFVVVSGSAGASSFCSSLASAATCSSLESPSSDDAASSSAVASTKSGPGWGYGVNVNKFE